LKFLFHMIMLIDTLIHVMFHYLHCVNVPVDSLCWVKSLKFNYCDLFVAILYWSPDQQAPSVLDLFGHASGLGTNLLCNTDTPARCRIPYRIHIRYGYVSDTWWIRVVRVSEFLLISWILSTSANRYLPIRYGPDQQTWVHSLPLSPTLGTDARTPALRAASS